MRSVCSRFALSCAERRIRAPRKKPGLAWAAAGAGADLGGDNPVIAVGGDGAADDLFRRAGIIDVGRVDEVDAEAARLVDDPARGGFVGGAAEHHGAEANRRDLQSGAAELDILHAVLVSNGCQAVLPKRISEKCPIGGIGRRSITRMFFLPDDPARQPRPGKFRPPAEPARHRRERQFEGAPHALFRADVIDQHDLAARPHHAREFVERGFRIGHGGDDILRHHHVEGIVGKARCDDVHHRQRIDIGQRVLRARAACALRSIGSEMSMPTSRLVRA